MSTKTGWAQSLTYFREMLKIRLLFDYLDAPAMRIAGRNVAAPFSPALEDLTYPKPTDIVLAVKALVS